jgi:hypothetical protein
MSSSRLKSGAPVWPWQKCRPRPSLVRVGQAATARTWILNLVQSGHWLAVFIGFWVGWIVFAHLGAIEHHLGSIGRVYALQLSVLLPAMASGYPVLMHACEGWQTLPERGTVDPDDGHDPVLRGMAYRFLFSGLTLSQLLLSFAVFGAEFPVLPVLVVLALVVLLGPARPLLPWRHHGSLLLPLPVSLALAFALSLALGLCSSWSLMAGPLVAAGLPSMLALAPLACLGLGGALEGCLAETSYNQWWHLAAVIAFISGFVIYGLLLSIAFP